MKASRFSKQVAAEDSVRISKERRLSVLVITGPLDGRIIIGIELLRLFHIPFLGKESGKFEFSVEVTGPDIGPRWVIPARTVCKCEKRVTRDF